MLNQKNSGAFTLIELLVVVAVIAILAAIAVPNFLEAQIRAKVSRSKADMRTIATAMETYVVDHNKYPPNFNTGLYAGIVVESEALSFSQLTTPLAYLSSTPLDIFAPDKERPQLGNYFDYVGIDTVAAQPPPQYPAGMREYWQGNGIRWFVASRGPDLMVGGLGVDMQNGVNNVYDPTNGTVSAGDIGRTNRGMVALGG